MKKFVILLICVCLLLCSCNAVNDDKDQTDKSTQVTDGSETNNSELPTSDNNNSIPPASIEEYDCFSIEPLVLALIQTRLDNPDDYLENILKVHRIGYLGFCGELSNISLTEYINEYAVDRDYFVEHKYESIQNQRFRLDGRSWADQNVLSIIENLRQDSWPGKPDWSLAYDYILNADKIFEGKADVLNAYCLYIGDAGSLTHADVVIYYETNKGDFILLRPMNYEALEPNGLVYDSKCKPIGYSDTVYLFPREVLKEAREYLEPWLIYNDAFALGYTLNASQFNAESRLQDIIDLEPYKLVPGQLPE